MNIPVTAAKAKLPEILRQVELSGEEVTLTRHRKPVAKIVPTGPSVTTGTKPGDWGDELRKLHAEVVLADIEL